MSSGFGTFIGVNCATKPNYAFEMPCADSEPAQGEQDFGLMLDSRVSVRSHAYAVSLYFGCRTLDGTNRFHPALRVFAVVVFPHTGFRLRLSGFANAVGVIVGIALAGD